MSLLTRSFLLLFLCLTATKVTIYAYNGNPNAPIHRRNWINGFAAASGSLAVAASTNIHAANAVISSKYCAYGTGQGCEDLAEGNEFIKELQARSAANKEAIQLEARNSFYMRNYPDWFASVGKTMVKKPDGTFMLVDDVELQKLKKENKLGLEYPTAMGGKVADLTQKPVMVLKE